MSLTLHPCPASQISTRGSSLRLRTMDIVDAGTRPTPGRCHTRGQQSGDGGSRCCGGTSQGPGLLVVARVRVTGVSHSDSRNARSRAVAVGGSRRVSTGCRRVVSAGSSLGQGARVAQRGAGPAFCPRWGCGPWPCRPILGFRSQHRAGEGGVACRAVDETWGPDHRGRLPSATRLLLPSHLPPLVTASHQGQPCKMKRGESNQPRTTSFPQGRRTLRSRAAGRQAPPAGLHQVPPSSSDTPQGHTRGCCLQRLLQSVKGGPQEDASQKDTQPTNLRDIRGEEGPAPAVGPRH